jgi:hypothetical protein
MRHHLLLLEHIEDKTCKKTTKKKTKRRKRVDLQTPALPSHFWLSLLPFCLKCFVLVATSALSLLALSFALPLQALPSFDDGVSAK